MDSLPIFTGCATALITPFTETGVDFEALGNLIEFQIAGKIDALVVLGTTGEPSTMTSAEKIEVIKFAISKTNKRVPVIVGTGANNTACAVENAKIATELGADALLVVTPYYNKCTQNGLVQYYQQVAEATPLPLIVYNVPSRTGVNITPATIEKLKNIKTVRAVKEASGNIEQICEIARLCTDSFSLYSGDDGIALPVLALGGIGVISVAGNVVPNFMHELTHNYLNGNVNVAREMQLKLLPFVKSLFCEVNPIPVKFAAHKLGLCKNILREPLTCLEQENIAKLEAQMKAFGLI